MSNRDQRVVLSLSRPKGMASALPWVCKPSFSPKPYTARCQSLRWAGSNAGRVFCSIRPCKWAPLAYLVGHVDAVGVAAGVHETVFIAAANGEVHIRTSCYAQLSLAEGVNKDPWGCICSRKASREALLGLHCTGSRRLSSKEPANNA